VVPPRIEAPGPATRADRAPPRLARGEKGAGRQWEYPHRRLAGRDPRRDRVFAGLRALGQETREANEGLLDAYWEVSDTLRKREKVLKALGEEGVPAKELAAMTAMYDAVQAAVGILDGGESGVRSMDVWVARFQVV
jgi:hypothetical protein